jgi:hypothetical protein
MIIDTEKLKEAINDALEKRVQQIEKSNASDQAAIRALTDIESQSIKYSNTIGEIEALVEQFLS